MAEYIDREALEKAMTIAAANGKDKGGMTMVNGRTKQGIALTKTLKTLATKFTAKKTVASYRTQKTSVR